jgi:hypothetical protein
MGVDEYSLIYRNLFNQSVMKGNYQVRDKQSNELICVCESLHNANMVKNSIEHIRPSIELEIVDCTISL